MLTAFHWLWTCTLHEVETGTAENIGKVETTFATNRKICRFFTKSDTTKIPSIIWGRNAEILSINDNGTVVELSGVFQSRSYNKKIDDVQIAVETTEISVQTINIEGIDSNTAE